MHQVQWRYNTICSWQRFNVFLVTNTLEDSEWCFSFFRLKPLFQALELIWLEKRGRVEAGEGFTIHMYINKSTVQSKPGVSLHPVHVL